jgi:hypothetical protein
MITNSSLVPTNVSSCAALPTSPKARESMQARLDYVPSCAARSSSSKTKKIVLRMMEQMKTEAGLVLITKSWARLTIRSLVYRHCLYKQILQLKLANYSDTEIVGVLCGPQGRKQR